jgi:hypothetical protein
VDSRGILTFKKTVNLRDDFGHGFSLDDDYL